MKTVNALIVVVITTTVLMSGCANNYARPAPAQSYNTAYGVIESIDAVHTTGDSGIGAGTVIGGVIGGVLGNQVGSGRGNTAATIAGAAGGAVVGHEIEKNRQSRDSYQIRVRLDNGNYQTLTQDDISNVNVGSRVRIENDHVYRY